MLPLFPDRPQLVPPAATYVEGGEVFLLNMGEPVRIKALAEQMVRLGWLSVRDASNPAGEIEIVCNHLQLSLLAGHCSRGIQS